MGDGCDVNLDVQCAMMDGWLDLMRISLRAFVSPLLGAALVGGKLGVGICFLSVCRQEVLASCLLKLNLPQTSRARPNMPKYTSNDK
jgi:hypothetical protein